MEKLKGHTALPSSHLHDRCALGVDLCSHGAAVLYTICGLQSVQRPGEKGHSDANDG